MSSIQCATACASSSSPDTRAVCTVLSGKQILSSVYTKVCRQAALVSEAADAVRALEGILSSVQQLVLGQVDLSTRAVCTVLAGIWFLPSVQS